MKIKNFGELSEDIMGMNDDESVRYHIKELGSLGVQIYVDTCQGLRKMRNNI